MEASVNNMTNSNPRLKLKKPLDVWSTREKLCLASAVFKIGDQNWVSVSRAIKPYADLNRPPDWFHQKNCLLQYYDMLEQLEQPKRKRGGDKSETDAPSLQIMRKMTIERSEQLKKEVLEMEQSFKTLKSEVEAIKAGQWDDRIKDVWEEIQEELRASENKIKEEVAMEDDDEELKALAADTSDLLMPIGDIDDSTQDSIDDISVLTDEESIANLDIVPSMVSTPSQSSELSTKLPAASHLLSSLLKSEVKSATGLQQLKLVRKNFFFYIFLTQGGQHSLLAQVSRSLLKTPITQDDPLTTPPSSSAPTLSRLLSTAKSQSLVTNILKTVPSTSTLESPAPDDLNLEDSVDLSSLLEEVVSEMTEISSVPDVTIISQNEEEPESVIEIEEVVKKAMEVKEEENVLDEEEIVTSQELVVKEEEQTRETPNCQGVDTSIVKEEREKTEDEEEAPLKKTADSVASETELPESSVKDESPSPTSSICSRISETGSKRGRRGRPRSAKSRVNIRKSYTMDEDKKDDGSSSKHSDVDSEDDMRSDDPQLPSVNHSSILSESFPNSPASLSICSDTEEEKSLKQWKKSIMLVWRAAATHKYANVFLHPVTDDIAPGYRSVVHRPMDLSTIKKNVENGAIRTTVEFQRDMMLMFTNAIMYNSSNHNVFKMAKEMYDDVMQHIEQYVNTQMMIQTTDAKNLRQSRRPDTSDKVNKLTYQTTRTCDKFISPLHHVSNSSDLIGSCFTQLY
ncbi:unnamed protein product [Lymnaea stagnalis]|uniref:Bromo domain-containing protein n=1 Tax=Lymnaea stagnalis TaxID=6523 RepID=A0AAV2IKA3_LYMST